MKNAKKLAALLLSVVMIISMMIVPVSAKELCSQVPNGSNVNGHNYTSNWAKVIGSYLTETADGKIMRVQSGSDGKAYVEYYDSSFNLTGQKTISASLPIFGGFYKSGNNYYILSGQRNPDYNDSVEVYRLTKYDTNWNELGHASLFGANTFVPFDGGSARFASCGKYILIRTCHKMYVSSDGYNHQANVTIEVDTSNMTVTDSYTEVMNSTYGYVSHSFNQFIQVENNNIIGVDHGDAYPRSVALIKYQTDCSTGKFVPGYYTRCSVYNMLSFAGSVGDNYTGAQIGGFEISDTSYLVAGTTIEQVENASKTSNVYVSVMNKADNTITLKNITNTAEGETNPSNPFLVKLSDNSFMLIWSVGTTVYYCKLDGNGNVNSKIYTMNGSLSDCDPIVCGNKVMWYSYIGAEVTFYEISLSDLSQTNVTTVENSHNWVVKSVDDNGNVELACSKCGETKSGVIPKSVSLWWNVSGNSWSSAPRNPIFAGNKISVETDYSNYSGNSATLKDCVVTSSDESIATVSGSSNGAGYYDIMWKKAGAVTITVSSLYNSSISKSYKINVTDYITPKGTGVIDSENKLISGIAVGSDSITDYVTPASGVTLNVSAGKLVTGTSVEVLYNGNVVRTYKTVIFGDVNGDGWYDGTDSLIVNCIVKGLLSREQVGEAVYKAADCNHDGAINESDVVILQKAGLLISKIDQTKTADELLLNADFSEYLSLISQQTASSDEPVDEEFNSNIFHKIIEFIICLFRMIISYIPK